MTAALASLLISIATALLRTILQQRQAANDAHEVGRLSGVIANLEAANVALKFKADAVRDPAGATDLRVRDDGKRIKLSGDDAGTQPPPSPP